MSTVYEIVNGGSSIPYHFLFYMLAQFVNTSNNDIIYYFPTTCKFSEEMLALLPWTRHREKQEGYNYVTSHITNSIFFDWCLPQSYTYIRHLFTPYIAPRVPGRKIYISRNHPSNRPSRQILNEDELLHAIEPLGFVRIFMEDLSCDEQIRIVSEAEVILSPHGSALAFTVFCSYGTKIIEILQKNTTENRHYSHIAWALGFEFSRFQKVDTVEENLLVNCDALVEHLGRVL